MLSSVDVSEYYLKDDFTILLTVDEAIEDEQLEAINKALSTHKEFNNAFKMMKYDDYMVSMGYRKTPDGVGYEDATEDVEVEVADNFKRQRNAVVLRKGRLGGTSDETPDGDDDEKANESSDSEEFNIDSLI